jgi:hypothetical protein
MKETTRSTAAQISAAACPADTNATSLAVNHNQTYVCSNFPYMFVHNTMHAVGKR